MKRRINLKKIYGLVYFLILAGVILYLTSSYAQDTLREGLRERWLERRSSRQDSAQSGEHQFSLVHQGFIRKYNVYLPASYDKNVPTAVVIYLHGGGGSVKAAYKDGMDKASDKFGFILIIPAGTGPVPNRLLTWNGGKWPAGKGGFGFESCCGYAVKNNIDDVGFISKVIEEVKNKFKVDGKRIYATGISNGGIMSYRLACELSDKIAAIAPVAPPAVPANCAPSRPVPVMHIHGTRDPCAPYDGGTGGGCLGSEKYEMQSAKEMVDIWMNINKCSGSPIISYQKGDVTCISYNKCAGNSEVEFCTVEGGGHTWPSGSQYLPVDRIGPVTYDISFEQIWEFFKKHPMDQAMILSKTYGPGDYDFFLVHDGLKRIYKVHAPPSYDINNPNPVVLNFHGGYGNAEAAERQTEMRKTSDKEGFILVYPEAVVGSVSSTGMHYQHWNGGPRVESDKSQEVNDVGFISALLDKLEEDFNIDSKMIYATGISNGGTLVYRLACQLSDRIAAVAPIETNQLNIECNPTRPVSIMHFHGLADRFVPYAGGVGSELPDDWKPVETTISEWKEHNGCPAVARITYKKGGATCRTYGPCEDNTELTLCTIEEHGHTWPAGPDNGDGAKVCQSNPKGFLCKKMREYFGSVSQDISANDAMWEFFRKHPLK